MFLLQWSYYSSTVGQQRKVWMPTQHTLSIETGPGCFICVRLLGAPLPRYKVPVIEPCHNVSLSEKLFMRWQCDQVEESRLIQYDLASAAFITAGY